VTQLNRLDAGDLCHGISLWKYDGQRSDRDSGAAHRGRAIAFLTDLDGLKNDSGHRLVDRHIAESQIGLFYGSGPDPGVCLYRSLCSDAAERAG
jgi:hypothetical protein